MITLTKQGSSLIVTSDDINVFPFKDGTISLPMNSLYIIIDESNYVSFKQVNDNNQLFGTEIGKLTINGTLATKENIIQLFDSVANAVSTGGGGEGGAVSSVNGQTGAVIITPENIGAYSTTEADSKFATIESLNSKQDELVSGTNIKTINNESILGEGNITIDVDTSNLLTKDEASNTYQVKGDYATQEELDLKANTSDLSNYLLKTDAESTYAKESEITNLNNVKLDKSVYETDKPTFALKTEIPDVSNFITNEDLESNNTELENQINLKQDKLTAGSNITISEDNVISANVSATTTVNWDDVQNKPDFATVATSGDYNDLTNKPNIPSLDGYATETYVNEAISGKADKTELSQYETTAHAAETYQPKGDYLTSIPDEYVTDTELNSALSTKLDSATYEADKPTFALKSEIPTDYVTEDDLTSYATKEELGAKQDTLVSGQNIKTINSQSLLGEGNIEITVEGGGISDAPSDGKLYGRKDAQWTEVIIPDTSNLATKDELNSKLDVSVYNEDKATFALKTEIPDTSDMLTKTEASNTYQVKGNYALKSEIPSLDGYATEAFVNEQISTETTERQKQDTALGGMIAGETEAREQAISALTQTVNSKADTSDLSNYLLKTDAESTYAKESEITNLNNVKLDKSVYEADKPTFALKSEIPDTSNFITNEELEGKDYATETQLSSKQDTLISGQNIKTINSQSILGEGDLVINGNNEYDFNQIKTESEYRNNFITNAKCGDIIKSISDSNITGITDVDYAIIICIDGNNYSLIVNNIANPFLLNFNVSVDEAVISNYLKLWVNVDAEINNTSTNPVENKVIYNELSNKLDKLTIDLDDNNGSAVNPTNLISHIPNALTVGTATVIYSQLTKALISYIGTDNKVYLATLNSNQQEDSTYKWEIENIYEIGNNSGGGIEYTAGSGITISDENVISLDYNVFDFSGNSSNTITIDGIFEKIKIGDILKNVNISLSYLSDFFVANVVSTVFNPNLKKILYLIDFNALSTNTINIINISISNNDVVTLTKNRTINLDKLDSLNTEWFGTTEEYNAIVTKDENTLYYITDDVTE